MILIVLFAYFSMQQYSYRSSHRERFSSLMFGKVCPGKGLCNEDLEWVLMLLDIYASQIVIACLLPIYTIDFVSLRILSFKEQ